MNETLLGLTGDSELDEAIRVPCAVVYKHSPRCGICADTLLEVRHFASLHPGVPVYVVDVLANRRLSRAIAKRFGIMHQSPQVILLRDGTPVWHVSHFEITTGALEQRMAGAR